MLDYLLIALSAIVALISFLVCCFMAWAHYSYNERKHLHESSSPLGGPTGRLTRAEGVAEGLQDIRNLDGTPVVSRRLRVWVRFKGFKTRHSIPIFEKVEAPGFVLATAHGRLLVRNEHLPQSHHKSWNTLPDDLSQKLLDELGEPPQQILDRLVPRTLTTGNPFLDDGTLEFRESWLKPGEKLWVVGPMKESDDPQYVGIIEGPMVSFMEPFKPMPKDAVHSAKLVLVFIASASICLASVAYLMHATR